MGDTAWLLLMSAMLFVLLLPISSYVAALSLIREEWGLNNTQAGAIYSAYLAGYVLSALLVVPLTDRIGPMRILIASAVVSTGAHVLFPLVAEGVVTAVLLRALAGAGLVGLYMPGLRLIAERFEGNRRGAAMGLYVTAQYGANSVSLALTGLLMSGLEWRDAYLYVCAAAAAGLPLAVVLLRGRSLRSQPGAKGRLDFGVFRNLAASYLIFGYAIHALQLFAARVWLPVFLVGVLVGRGLSASEAAVEGATLGGLALMAGSVGPLMGGVISDRWGRGGLGLGHLRSQRRLRLAHRLDRRSAAAVHCRPQRSIWVGDSGRLCRILYRHSRGDASREPGIDDGSPGVGGAHWRRSRAGHVRRHSRPRSRGPGVAHRLLVPGGACNSRDSRDAAPAPSAAAGTASRAGGDLA